MQNHKITFVTSNNGISTCIVDNKYLHSRYNPQLEAIRNFETQINQCMDKKEHNIIILIGGGMGYGTKALEELFPYSIIISIIFHAEIFAANPSKNKILYDSSHSTDLVHSIRKILQSTIQANNFHETLVLVWPPSANIWAEHTPSCIKEVRKALALYYTETNTIKHFLSQWIRNACFHYLNINQRYVPLKTDKNIVIAGAGPDLNYQIPKLQKSRKEFILIAVSSALKCLLTNNLYPDIIVHQDSSYYAARLLASFPINYTPYIALPLHASRSSVIRNTPCIVLNTHQEAEHLLEITKQGITIAPHGTVFGTALELAWLITNNKVILTGFDLSIDATGSHCFPHASANIASRNILLPEETQIIQAYFNAPYPLKETRYNLELRQNDALRIYADWFLRWKHPLKHSRCLVLSDIHPPHYSGITNIQNIPKSTAHKTNSLKFNKVSVDSIKNRTATLLSLADKWLLQWDILHNNNTIKSNTQSHNALTNTLLTIKSNMDHPDFIQLVGLIQTYARNTVDSPTF